jgi:hypothetical protein
MSFDLFMQCYGETHKLGLPVGAMRALFPICREEPEFNRWVVEYDPMNSCDIYAGLLKDNRERLGDFMVSRPCGDMRLWEALFSILNMGSVVIFWPGSPPVLAAGTNADSLPDGMVEGLGQPVYVHSGSELLKCVQET